jgi:peptide/nickel transport system substrate-binding protein
MKKWALLIALLTIGIVALAACGPAPTPQVVEKPVTVVVEKEVPVEKEVVRTVVVEQERLVEKKVVETVVVEKEKERVVTQVVERVVTPTPRPSGPKILVVGQAQEPDTLYWYGGSMLAARHVQHALFDGPYDNRGYDYQAIIMEKMPSVDDGDAVIETVTIEAGDNYVEAGAIMTATEEMELERLVVTWQLKEGILWEDGEPLTADDVIFSHELACHPDTPVSKYLCDRTTSYEAPDDLTVVWTGLPGYMDATYFANFRMPMPEHVLGDMAPADILTSDYSRSPLSFGPFKMVEWVAGDHITVERNPNYYRAGEGLPKLDQVIFKFVPDTNQLLAQLLAGEVDIGTQDGLDMDQSPFLLQAEQQGIVKPQFITGTVWEHIDFNIQPVDDRYVFFDDVLVRQAIAYGTDRQAMVDVIYYGKSKVQHSYIPTEHPMYPPEDMITEYEYDPERAMELLAEAGWTDTDGDGFVDKDGQIFEVSLGTTSGNKLREQTTQLFQQNMKDIGIKVNLDLMPASIWFANGPDGPLFGRRFDLGEFAWLTGVEPPGELYMCDLIPGPENEWAGQNETGYCNPEYDEWVNKALGTLSKAEQTEAWAEAQAIFSEELPVLPLFARVKVSAARPEVLGVQMDPTENSEMWNIEQFDLMQ